METDDNPQSVPSRCADKGWEALTEDGDDGVEPLHLARICRTTEAELPAQLFVVLVSAHAVPSREVLRRRRYLKALQQSVHFGLRVHCCLTALKSLNFRKAKSSIAFQKAPAETIIMHGLL